MTSLISPRNFNNPSASSLIEIENVHTKVLQSLEWRYDSVCCRRHPSHTWLFPVVWTKIRLPALLLTAQIMPFLPLLPIHCMFVVNDWMWVGWNRYLHWNSSLGWGWDGRGQERERIMWILRRWIFIIWTKNKNQKIQVGWVFFGLEWEIIL